MNFPSRRAPGMMKPVLAEILDGRTRVRAAVVVVVPHEITSHPHFLHLVPCSMVADVSPPEEFSQRLNPYAVSVDALLGAWRNLTNDWRRIADLWCVIA